MDPFPIPIIVHIRLYLGPGSYNSRFDKAFLYLIASSSSMVIPVSCALLESSRKRPPPWMEVHGNMTGPPPGRASGTWGWRTPRPASSLPPTRYSPPPPYSRTHYWPEKPPECLNLVLPLSNLPWKVEEDVEPPCSLQAPGSRPLGGPSPPDSNIQTCCLFPPPCNVSVDTSSNTTESPAVQCKEDVYGKGGNII